MRDNNKMNIRNFFHTVRPFISALAVTATAAALVFTIYFTELGMQWVTFLGGVLVAAILAEATRVSRVEWVATRRSAQLSTVKGKLDRETQLRKRAEEALASAKGRLHLVDEVLPTMVALFDSEGRCRYHNKAFMDWLHLRPEHIQGQHIRKVLGTTTYQEIAPQLRQSQEGQPAHYERTQLMPDGAIYHLLVEHVPQFADDGKVTGFYMLINDITSPGDVHGMHHPAPPETALAGPGVTAPNGKTTQDIYVDSLSEQVAGQKDASLIREAIEKGEFCLFSQSIRPILPGSGEAEHFEILVRLLEEEEGMMPPGAFFPLAEKYGLMQNLDRWVVQHVTEWISRHNSPDKKLNDSVFFINLSSATIIDRGFPEFLQLTLMEYGIPGTFLCFEIPNTELAARTNQVAEFAQQVRQSGCRVAISGFGQDRAPFDLIRHFQVDFLKIDGHIVFDVLRDPVSLAKVTAINRVAKLIGVKTIAELVESEETIAKLKEVGIDFAQGFGISRPQPLPDSPAADAVRQA